MSTRMDEAVVSLDFFLQDFKDLHVKLTGWSYQINMWLWLLLLSTESEWVCGSMLVQNPAESVHCNTCSLNWLHMHSTCSLIQQGLNLTVRILIAPSSKRGLKQLIRVTSAAGCSVVCTVACWYQVLYIRMEFFLLDSPHVKVIKEMFKWTTPSVAT